jgi:hypothetical protein
MVSQPNALSNPGGSIPSRPASPSAWPHKSRHMLLALAEAPAYLTDILLYASYDNVSP